MYRSTRHPSLLCGPLPPIRHWCYTAKHHSSDQLYSSQQRPRPSDPRQPRCFKRSRWCQHLLDLQAGRYHQPCLAQWRCPRQQWQHRRRHWKHHHRCRQRQWSGRCLLCVPPFSHSVLLLTIYQTCTSTPTTGAASSSASTSATMLAVCPSLPHSPSPTNPQTQTGSTI